MPSLPQATGMMELEPVRSPFGVAVAADGRLRRRVVLQLAGLPRADSLGAFRHYVAWSYTITMDGERRLGEVGNGRTTLGEVPYEPFRILVSAESSAAPDHRGGKLVMRTTSPSALLLAHRDVVMAMTGRMTVGGDPVGAGEHAGHDMPGRWSMPPDDPRLTPMAMPHMTPGTAPWLPDSAGRRVEPARPREMVTLRSGDTLALRAGLVRRTIGSRTFLMYGYNGQYPGPLIRVGQGTEVTVRFHNDLDLPSTIHWHGLRLDNASDGVPGITQDPVASGDSFTYHLRFPDAGIYWYHPHVREDVQQELGLYGNILVARRRAGARVPVHREEVVALDDFLAGGAGVVPFGRDAPTHALMGRFGNVYLLNGEPDYTLRVRRDEVVRFYFTNVANARTFNLRIPGARLKLVGSDLSDFEREEWVESVIIAPAERYVVEARFDQPGTFAIVNGVQWLDHMMGTFATVDDTIGHLVVRPERATPDYRGSYARLQAHRDVTREFAAVRRLLPAPPTHLLTLGVRVRNVSPLVVAMMTGMPVPVDWNDGMPMMNWPLTADEVTWFLRDENGRENMDIRWQMRRGDLVKIRLVNDPATLHAMAHPIHFHGQRLAVIARNGIATDNLVWKDTALLPAGETMDIVLEASNPGRWMAHCHIAEHLGTGMMLTFDVTP
ncbi:MAG: multicopper oxidase family protein [Gemmatimonadaceae bacterium]